ncbi:Signal transducer regulating beta-lactamase production, contains metallopeptidase domain (fragment) [Tenacibaculum sediminilitoris]|uniref:M56 family metallopeptidase n=1 Tax=Tenacibaculum sediminilitoris TaxID=1820334 RepID=UPI0038965B37
MITYFIKSGICLALLLVFYHLVLEREKMHQFNRFYLLGSILFSFLAPFYKIYEKTATQTSKAFQTTIINSDITTNTIPQIEEINYTLYLLIGYTIITLALLVRFIKNLISLYLKIKQHPKIKKGQATIVLVNDAICPYTFWNYIFINKEEYSSNKIETELYTHELTHASQKHTFDILLIEFLQVVFWINPIFIFLKKAIKLNHEFLADSKVISTYKNTTKYQYLLLNRAAWNNEYYLASNLNYLLTKKRLLMMTKQSSNTKILLKKLSVIPVLIGFTILFAERIEAKTLVINNDLNPEISILENTYEKTQPQSSSLSLLENIAGKENSLDFDLTNNKKIEFNSTMDSIPKSTSKRFVNQHKSTFTYTTKSGEKITKKLDELTDKEKKMLPPPPPPVKLKKRVLSKKLFQDLKNPEKYAIWIDGKAVNNTILNSYKSTDFFNYSGSFIHENARTTRFPQKYQYQLNTKNHIKEIQKKLLPPPPPKI